MKLIRFKKKRRHSTRNISKIESLSLVKFGSFGLKTKTAGILTMKQIETIRRLLSRKTKRISKITIRIFFQHPIKKKSLLSRMGKGIGGVKSWVSWVSIGTILIEIGNTPEKLAKKILKDASYRLPMKVVYVRREVDKMLEER